MYGEQRTTLWSLLLLPVYRGKVPLVSAAVLCIPDQLAYDFLGSSSVSISVFVAVTLAIMKHCDLAYTSTT